MTGDHHGQTAGTATLLVRAVDGILGTHRWLKVHGHEKAYVLSDQWIASFVPARPYLLTSNEIEAFFTAAAALTAQSPWRWQAVAFFALMHSCGLA
jgi:hypothetical protein